MDWVYNDVFYNSTEALRAAIKDPSFARSKPNLDGDWTDTEDYSKGTPERQMPPPVMIQPMGPRYHIDRKENYVSWSKSAPSSCRTLHIAKVGLAVGFDFYYSTNQITGVSLFDIRFKGERIIYEVSLSDNAFLTRCLCADPL